MKTYSKTSNRLGSVAVVEDLACPFCGQNQRAQDVRFDREGHATLICTGCHTDILKISLTGGPQS
jgi:hypothetical protein